MATTENSYTGDGNTTLYSFTFPYLKEADVKVDVAGVNTNAYTFHNATTISLTNTPASGVVVRVYRSTDDSGLSSTFYPGSAIRSGDLNNNFTQNLYSTQENTNDASDALDNSRVLESGVYVPAITKATQAVATADAADAIADAAKLATDTYVHDGTNLKGDGLGGNPQGVAYAVAQADQAYLNSVFQLDSNGEPAPLPGADANTAVEWAKFAWDYSVIADDNATDALDNSRVANGTTPETYTSAIQKATDADTTATAANNTAGNAAADATAALDNSRTKTDGSEAIPTPGTYTSAIYLADAALDNSRKSDGATPPVYTSAIDVADAATVTAGNAAVSATNAVNTANTASANATAAQNAVTNAELFTPYAAVSDIPSNNISSITVTDGGSEYQTVPAVTITNTTGATGSGAIATAVLTDGVVTSITVSSKGNNYDNGATVAIAQSTGTGGTHATATAVLGPLNEDKAEVADSTGLETFTPLTGKPAGFILGDDGLTVKLRYNTSLTTWEWVNYYSNDPETRYRKKLIVENLITISENYTVGVGNNAHSVGPITISHNGTNLTYNDENHAQPYVALNAATAGYTVTIPENSTWLIN